VERRRRGGGQYFSFIHDLGIVPQYVQSFFRPFRK
jgi:hypothetical protein